MYRPFLFLMAISMLMAQQTISLDKDLSIAAWQNLANYHATAEAFERSLTPEQKRLLDAMAQLSGDAARLKDLLQRDCDTKGGTFAQIDSGFECHSKAEPKK